MIRAVLCERCGSRLERPGQGHTCRPAHSAPEPLPLGWQVTTWVVVTLSALLIACIALSAVVRLKIMTETLADPVLGPAGPVVAAGLLAATLIWSRGTRRIADRFSDTSGWYVRPSSVLRVYGVLLLLGVAVVCLGGGRLGTAVVVGHLVQVLVIAFLAVAVVAGWMRIRRLAADSYTQTYYAGTFTAAATPAPDAAAEPLASPIVEQSRGLTPHKAPLTAQATEADWNPHEWDPQVRDEIERRRRTNPSARSSGPPRRP